MGGYPPGRPTIPPQPAAGQPFTYTPSGAEFERIEAVTFELVTSNAVATRIVTVSLVDGSGEAFAVTASPFTQTASHTCLYSFFLGGQQYGANNAAHIGGPLPAPTISTNVSLEVAVDAMDAGDALGKVRLFVVGYPFED